MALSPVRTVSDECTECVFSKVGRTDDEAQGVFRLPLLLLLRNWDLRNTLFPRLHSQLTLQMALTPPPHHHLESLQLREVILQLLREAPLRPSPSPLLSSSLQD
jgi:hypothetical protein